MFSRFGLYAIAAAVALLGLAYLDARLDRANEADALEEQVAAMTAEATAKDAIAAALETKLQAVRMEAAEINRKWSDLRAEKNRPVCRLDDATRSLLKSAAAPDAR